MTSTLLDSRVTSAGRRAGVEIDDVSIAYERGTPVVRNVSLTVDAGSTVALLGPSGSGKTSLLRAIAGLERPVGGSIRIGGTVVSAPRTWVKPERRAVGMVFQDGALFPHLTVADNIAFGLGRRSGTDVDARVRSLLELVDLVGYGDRLPGTLSGGQRQRVALARSLAPEPSVLLLDEPFSALDASLRVQVRAEVGRIIREIGVTAVFVTHDQDEAFVLGDSVAVMRDGVVEQAGTPDELYRRPASPWVAQFVGEANILPCRAAGQGEAATAVGSVPVTSSSTSLVLIRPEQLVVEPGADGVIADVEYYGHDTRYVVELTDGTSVAVRAMSDEVLERGASVGVRFVGGAVTGW